jgi:proteic killer suppression protein
VEEQLTALNRAKIASDMAQPLSWRLHRLQGKEKHWSIWVNGNWRLTFTFDGEDAILVDYQDYH